MAPVERQCQEDAKVLVRLIRRQIGDRPIAHVYLSFQTWFDHSLVIRMFDQPSSSLAMKDSRCSALSRIHLHARPLSKSLDLLCLKLQIGEAACEGIQVISISQGSSSFERLSLCKAPRCISSATLL